jgi:hypothetical protein
MIIRRSATNKRLRGIRNIAPEVRGRGVPIIRGTISHLPPMPKTCTTGLLIQERKICAAKAMKIPTIAATLDPATSGPRHTEGPLDAKSHLNVF